MEAKSEEMPSQDEEDSSHEIVDNTTGQTETYIPQTTDTSIEETQTHTPQTQTYISQTQAHTSQRTETHTSQTETYTSQTQTNTIHSDHEDNDTETTEDEKETSVSFNDTSNWILPKKIDSAAGQKISVSDFLPPPSCISFDHMLTKYWSQRFRLFSLYDQGIRMDHGK